MALGWKSSRPLPRTPRVDVLAIARADMEASSNLAEVDSTWLNGASFMKTDWWPSGKFSLPWRTARLATLVYRYYVKARKRLQWLPAGWVDRLGARFIKKINAVNVACATDLYGTARVVVVDRLHAHVLAALLSVPHVVMDNNYRKVSAIYDEYSGAFSTAHYAADLPAARAEILRLLGR